MSATPVVTAPATPPSAGESRATAWGFTGLLVALYVVNWADKAVLGLAAQPLMDELGLSASQIGLLGSAFFLTFTVGGFTAGLLNRWSSLKWILVLLALGWSVAMLPVIVSATFAVLLFSRMLLGFLEGPSSALIHTAVYSWHPTEKRGVPSACITAAASIAKIAIAPALAILMAAQGWRAAFVVLAVVGVVWAVIWLPTWRVGPYGSDKSTRAAAAAATDSGAETVEPTAPWVKVFTTPTFLFGALAVMSMYALVSVVLTFLPSFFEVGLGYSQVQAGTMFGLPSIASLVVMAVLSFSGDKLISRGATSRVLRGIVPAAGLLVCGLALTTLPLISTPIIAVAVVSIGYAFGAAIFPLFNSAVSQIVRPGQMAGTLGVFLAVMAIGGLIAPYATGLIVDAAATPLEGYELAFQVFGVAAAVAAVGALLAVNPERDRARLAEVER
jgi:sugar phosphate permease